MSSGSSCAVCGGSNHGVRFGVPACRACASFFKRTLLENKVYACRKQNDCLIDGLGMRNSCRACRLQRCRQAGMEADSQHCRLALPVPTTAPSPQAHQAAHETREENGAMPDDTIYIPSEGSSISAQWRILHTPQRVESSHQWTHLDRYLCGFRAFVAAQKSLYDVEHPELIFSEPKLEKIKMEESTRMDKQSMPLVYNMVCEYFTPLANFSPTEKKRLLRSFAYDFLCIYRCYLNVAMLPEGSPHLMCCYGRYMDGTNPANFLVDSNPTDEQITYMEQCTKRIHSVIQKFREISANELECGGLAAIILFTTMENLLLDVQQSRDSRDVVLAELLRYLNATNGPLAGGVRFGRLLLFLRELSVFMAWVEETAAFVKVFMDRDLYGFWNDEEPVPNGIGLSA